MAAAGADHRQPASGCREVEGEGGDGRGGRLGKVNFDDVADRAGHLVHQAAGLAEIDVFGKLGVDGDLFRRRPAPIHLVQDGADEHLKGRRRRKPAAFGDLGGGVGGEAADFPPGLPETESDPPDQGGGMGRLFGLGGEVPEVHRHHRVSFGLDPDDRLVRGGRDREDVDIDRPRHDGAGVVVGVVAQKLHPPRRGEEGEVGGVGEIAQVGVYRAGSARFGAG